LVAASARHFLSRESAERFRNRARTGAVIEAVQVPISEGGYMIVSEKSANRLEVWDGKQFTNKFNNRKRYKTEENAKRLMYRAFEKDMIRQLQIAIRPI
jgi:hypothetical protein